MLIINADDWGGWESATNAALACFQKGRITSVTAMVFMEDSERAATLAHESDLDVGLHLNLDAPFTGATCPDPIRSRQDAVRRWLKAGKYAQVIYNPFMAQHFREVFEAQVREFERLYGRRPSHIDGHHHRHLCSNVIFGGIIPRGEKVRRNFSFWPGQKNLLNRVYRRWVDKRLLQWYRTTDYFFAISECFTAAGVSRVADLAARKNVELMTHPEKTGEYSWLMSDDFLSFTRGMEVRSYANV